MPTEITFERLKMLVADYAMTEALLRDEIAALRAERDTLVSINAALKSAQAPAASLLE